MLAHRAGDRLSFTEPLPKTWFLGNQGEVVRENQIALLWNLATESILSNGVWARRKGIKQKPALLARLQPATLEAAVPANPGAHLEMGSCNETVAAQSSFCFAMWEDRHREGFVIITCMAQLGRMLGKEIPRFQCSVPAAQHGVETGSPWSPGICGCEERLKH